MFYDRFVQLCNQKGVSRTKACIDCGVSRTAWHKWEDGAIPNGITISKLSAYFGVSSSFLLCEDTQVVGNPDAENYIRNKFYSNNPHLKKDFLVKTDDFREFIQSHPKIKTSKRVAIFFLENFHRYTDLILEYLGIEKDALLEWVSHGVRLSFTSISEILNFFDLDFRVLLDEEDSAWYRSCKEKMCTESGHSEIALQDIDVGFYGDFMALSDDDKETVRDMVRIMRERRNKKG